MVVMTFDKLSLLSINLQKVTLPKLLQNKISFACTGDAEHVLDDVTCLPKPFAATDSFTALASACSKTPEEFGKAIYYVNVNIPDEFYCEYKPGDTIGIHTENSDESVDQLLLHTNEATKADELIKLDCSTTKRKLPITTTRRILLKKYVNFLGIPSKLFLCALSEYCDDFIDKRLLQILACKEGSDLYRSHVLETGATVFNVIMSLQSCKPSVVFLAEHLPSLLPRPYSIASSPLTGSSCIKFAFSVLRDKPGTCTSMLQQGFRDSVEFPLLMYFRISHGFRLPDDPMTPLILIGLGTGIAPYIGFLSHRSFEKSSGIVYLINGFRYRTDFIFLNDIEKFKKDGVLTKYFISHSREADATFRYVQDIILHEQNDLARLILEEQAVIYECGDTDKKKEPIANSLIKIIQTYLGFNNEEANFQWEKVKKEQRYLRDIWC